MLMEEVFERLREFQEILTKRVEIERDVEDIPKSLAAQEEVLSRIKKTYVERNAEFEAAEGKVKELRGQLAETEAAREGAEKQMDLISTQREYEALNKEIRDSTEKEHNLRKDLQKEERGLAEIEESLRKDEAMIKLQETEISEKSTKVGTERDSKLKEIEELKDREQKASGGIEKEVIFKFERIIRSKQGLGIVPVRGAVCTGCYMILPAQFVNEVRSGNRIIFCPYCSRVLYYEESEGDSNDQLFVDIESGSLSDLEDYAEEGEEEGYDDGDDGDKDGMDDSDN
ncbi:MAG TPA: C4-type zinc ribbon domain-containing protein [Rectinemataceae bacterium]|nr:C4-type zinc ribbon domain-containing protein [Rectinemataceae bacterium]